MPGVSETFLPRQGEDQCARTRIDEHPAPNGLVSVEGVGDLGLYDDLFMATMPGRSGNVRPSQSPDSNRSSSAKALDLQV